MIHELVKRATTGTELDGVPVYAAELWPKAQRAANNLHEVSYRACFKPQLPRYFVEALTEPGERVYDPFLGRGTTLVEAALLGRKVAGCDVNPLSKVLCGPRLAPPELGDVRERLAQIPFHERGEEPDDLLAFFHPETLREIGALRRWLRARELDAIDRWIEMVAVNRLTGHSPGFFSVYTMPPNQAVSVAMQRKINARRAQTPQRRSVPDLILKKTRQLLADLDASALARLAGSDPILITSAAEATPQLGDGAVDLVVTSPPFLDVVHYAHDNWLRCWFCGIDPAGVPITMARTVAGWQDAMQRVLVELRRVVRKGGHVAFEVGEVRGGKVRLEDAVIPAMRGAGLVPLGVIIHTQSFTKTAQCWGVENNAKGTNTQRIVVARRG